VKQFPASQIRNVALVGHQESGKTMLSESMLYTAGAIPRLAALKTATPPWTTTARKWRARFQPLGVAWCEHDGTKINHRDARLRRLVGDVLLALDVSESALIAIRADAGVEVGTDRVWGFVQDHGLPGLFVITRMDKEHAT
jgi:elongation factor G